MSDDRTDAERDVERAIEELRTDPAFPAIRRSFIEMCRQDLPADFDLSRIEADPDNALLMLIEMTMAGRAMGIEDPAPWFTKWAVAQLDGPTISVMIPGIKNKLN